MGHKHSLSVNKFLKLGLIYMGCVFLLMFFLFISAGAQGGVGISGSFRGHHYKVVPGETIDTPNVNIVVFNNNSKDARMRFNAEVPEGVSVDLDGKEFEISARSNMTFPVSISVDEMVYPGEYEVGVSVEGIPDELTGIRILGAAQLRTKLSIYAEAGWINIDVVTPRGEPFKEGEIHLYFKDQGKFFPMAHKRGSSFSERVVTGDYRVEIMYKGMVIGTKEFSLYENEEKNLNMVAKTVYVENFAVTPQYYTKNNKIASAIVNFTIRNLHKQIDDASVVLKVYYDGVKNRSIRSFFSRPVFSSRKKDGLLEDNLLEEIEIYDLITLEVGRQSGRSIYMPENGWGNGEYRFVLMIYGNDGSKISDSSGLFGESEVVSIVVDEHDSLGYLVMIIIMLMVVIIGIIAVKRKMKKEEEEELDREREIIEKLMVEKEIETDELKEEKGVIKENTLDDDYKDKKEEEKEEEKEE